MITTESPRKTQRVSKWLEIQIHPLMVFFILLFCLLAYDKTINTEEGILWLSIIKSAALTLIFFVIYRTDLTTLSLLYLYIPHTVFFVGWLNHAAAITMLTLTLPAIWHICKKNNTGTETVDIRKFLSFLLLTAWVIISGADGKSHQFGDYVMHNARLNDLINYRWPVHYDDNRNFVYYIGYFLPAAAIGKLSNFSIAMQANFIWATLGMSLAFRWLSRNTNILPGVILVVFIIIFGPIDILSLLYLHLQDTPEQLAHLMNMTIRDPGHLDFWSRTSFNYIVGGFLSNAFQLYWSPQQIIAGWLFAGLLLGCYKEKNIDGIALGYALLCLWAPLVMIATLPLVIVCCLLIMASGTRFSHITLLASVALACLYVTFYLGGSIYNHPTKWLPELLVTPGSRLATLLLIINSWGFYALMCCPFVLRMTRELQYFFIGLIISLLLLPIWIYGEYSDLLCRGSAPLMWLLLTFLLTALKTTVSERRYIFIILIPALILAGSTSFLLWTNIVIKQWGNTQEIRSVVDYDNAYPNLGPDNTLFRKYLAHPPVVVPESITPDGKP